MTSFAFYFVTSILVVTAGGCNVTSIVRFDVDVFTLLQLYLSNLHYFNHNFGSKQII